jgi:hypothetical protein
MALGWPWEGIGMKLYGLAIVASLLAASSAQGASLFEQLTPTPTTYDYLTEYGIATPVYYLDGPHTLGPAIADVTASLFLLSGSDGIDGLSLGCDGGDYGSGAAGHIVLLSRGTCTFAEKARLAEDAGALGVLFADYDTAPPSLNYTGKDDSVTILSFRVSNALSLALVDQARAQTTTVRLAVGDNLVSSFVPEPSTWAMMLAGFGLIGSTLRRRNRTMIRYA